MQKTKTKIPFAVLFSVGAVLFSAHAGGGFATGNQAHTYYVGLGLAGAHQRCGRHAAADPHHAGGHAAV